MKDKLGTKLFVLDFRSSTDILWTERIDIDTILEKAETKRNLLCQISAILNVVFDIGQYLCSATFRKAEHKKLRLYR